MGSFIEINDTLQLTLEQGFPKELKLERHLKKSFRAADFKNRVFEFYNKPAARIYKTPPVRNFLVHNIRDKWLYWGHCLVIEQTIHSTKDGKQQKTSGKFTIVQIYPPEYQEEVTKRESPTGKSFF